MTIQQDNKHLPCRILKTVFCADAVDTIVKMDLINYSTISIQLSALSSRGTSHQGASFEWVLKEI